MIKKILISLTSITIIGCCWFFFTLFDAIDLAPTKNNHLASEEKWKIEQQADIDSCEKNVLIYGAETQNESLNLLFELRLFCFL